MLFWNNEIDVGKDTRTIVNGSFDKLLAPSTTLCQNIQDKAESNVWVKPLDILLTTVI